MLSDKAVSDMNSILVQVPEWGTGRRAALPGVRSAGKTGTTQSYRDGWYVGYTGNYVGAVWLGNDDYRPTNRMTGGSLPAMVWQRFMTYAHRNVELKPIPGHRKPDGGAGRAYRRLRRGRTVAARHAGAAACHASRHNRSAAQSRRCVPPSGRRAGGIRNQASVGALSSGRVSPS